MSEGTPRVETIKGLLHVEGHQNSVRTRKGCLKCCNCIARGTALLRGRGDEALHPGASGGFCGKKQAKQAVVDTSLALVACINSLGEGHHSNAKQGLRGAVGLPSQILVASSQLRSRYQTSRQKPAIISKACWVHVETVLAPSAVCSGGKNHGWKDHTSLLEPGCDSTTTSHHFSPPSRDMDAPLALALQVFSLPTAWARAGPHQARYEGAWL